VPGAPVRVRWAQVRDAEAIARVHVDSWRATYRGLLPDEVLAELDVPRRTREWRERLREGSLPTLVAERGEEVVGFCTLALPARDAGEPDTVAEIPALYVHPRHVRAGIGSRLLEAAFAEMRARGFREAMLWMLAGNEGATRFYARTGWRDDGGRRGSQYFPHLRQLREVRYRRAL
jgi:GNAT superfamily N-acetyltransferase